MANKIEVCGTYWNMKSRIYWFLTNFKVNIKVKKYFAISNSEAEVAPSKTKGDPAEIQYTVESL